MAITKT